MNSKGSKRKLTAVFSADVVGYSRLMSEDDDATIRTVALDRFWFIKAEIRVKNKAFGHSAVSRTMDFWE